MGNFECNETKSFTVLKADAECACVYVFWLGTACQYIGKSKLGLGRPLSGNHKVRTIPSFDYDRLEIFKQVDEETAIHLEQRWIYKFSPVYNDQHINPQTCKLPIKGRDSQTGDYLVISTPNERGRRTEIFRSLNENERDEVWRAERKRTREEHNAEFKRQERARESL